MEQRIERALNEPIYVLDKFQSEAQVLLTVTSGTSSRTYNVIITPTTVTCSCPDHYTRKVMCKHILAVMLKVFKITPESLYECDTSMIFGIAGNQISTPVVSDDNTREDSECAVCYDTIKLSQIIRGCPTCKHIFHYHCIRIWQSHGHKTCPLCRGKL